MFGRWWQWLLTTLKVQYRVYRRWWWWLVATLIVGVIVAIVSIALGGITVDEINTALIDGNILNMATPDANIGGFIWQRVLVVVVPVAVLFAGGLVVSWGVVLIFPLVFFQGYWLCLSLWWVWLYYSYPGILLLVFYALWLVLVGLLLIAALLWVNQITKNLRACRCQGWPAWGQTLHGLLTIVLVAVVFGLIEYLVFWTMLGRFVYKGV